MGKYLDRIHQIQTTREDASPVERNSQSGEGYALNAFNALSPTKEELAEIALRVETEGYVLCYAEVLQDYVAFVPDGVNTSRIPSDFVIYTESELIHLFSDDKPHLSDRALRLIHEAKKTGAVVIGNTPLEEETNT